MELEIGSLVRMVEWNGIIVDVGEDTIEVLWVKNLFQGQGPETLPLRPRSFSPSSVTRIMVEMAWRSVARGMAWDIALS